MGILDSLGRFVQRLSSRLPRRQWPSPDVMPSRQLLSPDEMLVRTRLGFHLVVPTWNIDVAVGVIRDGQIESWTNEVVKHTLRRGDVFVNVGANFGYYAALGAQAVGAEGAVYAVEANPHIFVYLVKSIYWSGYPHIIRAFQCAAFSEHKKDMTLMFDRQFLGGGSVMGAVSAAKNPVAWSPEKIVTMVDERREWRVRGTFTSVSTEARRLDDTLPTNRPVRLLMMDIEGAEPHAILGAQKLIRRSPDLEVVMEWWPGSYQFAERRAPIDAMWDVLLNEKQLKPYRICSEGSRADRFPTLEPLTRESLFNVPHGDVYLRKAA